MSFYRLPYEIKSRIAEYLLDAFMGYTDEVCYETELIPAVIAMWTKGYDGKTPAIAGLVPPEYFERAPAAEVPTMGVASRRGNIVLIKWLHGFLASRVSDPFMFGAYDALCAVSAGSFENIHWMIETDRGFLALVFEEAFNFSDVRLLRYLHKAFRAPSSFEVVRAFRSMVAARNEDLETPGDHIPVLDHRVLVWLQEAAEDMTGFLFEQVFRYWVDKARGNDLAFDDVFIDEVDWMYELGYPIDEAGAREISEDAWDCLIARCARGAPRPIRPSFTHRLAQ